MRPTPSNFSFLADEWPNLHRKATLAEARANVEPESAAAYARVAMEEVLYTVYKAEGLALPYNKGLHSLLDHPEITALLGRSRINGAHLVRKTGNAAAHFGGRVSGSDARMAVKYLYDVCRWLALFYAETEPDVPAGFDESRMPLVGEAARKRQELEAETRAEFEAMQARVAALEAERDAAREQAKEAGELAQHKQLLALAKAQVQERRTEREHSAVAKTLHDTASFSESETRKHLIDADLRDAGWHVLRHGRELEYAVTGMPITHDNPNGNGYIDYVLWGHDGLPLALIEAKRTSSSSQVGRHQARLYAHALEAKFERRPIIYYTNGYETYVEDEAFYSAARQVHGFHTRDELALMIQRRSTREDPRTAELDPAIAGRSYQLNAIRAVADAFATDASDGQLRGNRRAALLVMATGSGKTRTAASLCKMLFEAGWLKRVLFLADRTALVVQAKRRFSEFLPDYKAINLVKEPDNVEPRLVFSTYQTILNRIDSSRAEDASRHYGIGHFDLLIVDEAHRSVYNRYGAIFKYFDALRLGLTATPKDSIDHNTFDLFGAPQGDPTFSYELDEATEAGYLTGYRTLDAELGFMRHGVKYKQLSDAEKEAFEDTFRDGETGLFPDEINASELNKKLFNRDTVNKVLDLLMDEGQRIEDGNSLGRTIIFAANQRHAEFIVECFTKRYPQLPAGFIEVVHNKVSHAQSLIDNFCEEYEERMPRVAVSVDMMDTGVDAPRVLNLVFFKAVRSHAKFWQMVGRGTRLCEDAFGPGKPKEHFYIIDVCENFAFFEAQSRGIEGKAQVSGAARLFRNRLQLMTLLLKSADEEERAFAKTLRKMLHTQVEALAVRGDIKVKLARRWVDKYVEVSRWGTLGEDELRELNEHIAVLVDPDDRDSDAQRFDALMVNLQLAKALAQSSEASYYQSLERIALALGDKASIPEVATRLPLIRRMQDPSFYKEQRQHQLEGIRTEIRGLIQYLDSVQREPVYTDFEDTLSYSLRENTSPPRMTADIYRRRVEEFVRKNSDVFAIQKLRSGKPLSANELKQLEAILFDGEDRGTADDFAEVVEEENLGSLTGFIRGIVGLDREAVDALFAEFVNTQQLSATQIKFIDQIKQNLERNGQLAPRQLFNDPYTSVHPQGLGGVFDDAQQARIVALVREVSGLVG